MIIILVNTFKQHPKVPAIEQKLSTAAATPKYNVGTKCNGVWGYLGELEN